MLNFRFYEHLAWMLFRLLHVVTFQEARWKVQNNLLKATGQHLIQVYNGVNPTAE